MRHTTENNTYRLYRLLLTSGKLQTGIAILENLLGYIKLRVM